MTIGTKKALAGKSSRTDISRLIRQGESESVEFKQSLDEEALESIAAFANAKGGALLIGVDNDGTVRGLQLGRETIRDWANRIAQSSRLNPRIAEVSFQGKTVVLVEVAESAVKPVPCHGRFFKRVGKSNRQMTDDDLTRMVLEKVGATWDEVAEPRAAISDISSEQLKRFRALCNREKRRPIPDGENDSRVLENLGLIKEGKLLRAAIILFGKEPQRFYPSASVKIGRFRPGNLIVDDREITGTLFDQVENTEVYFRERLQTRFEFHGEPAREVIWEYPLKALREAVINAVCHRDYLDVSQTQVRWHDERLVFLNPGGLTPPLSLESLCREHVSKPRNRKIAEMFYYAGFIEKWGGGTLQIIKSCKEAGLPEPQFEEEQGCLWLTLRPRVEQPAATPQVPDKYPTSTADDSSRKVGEKTREKTREKILHAIRENPGITTLELSEVIGVTRKAIEWNIKRLKGDGVLKRIGPDKGGHWKVTR